MAINNNHELASSCVFAVASSTLSSGTLTDVVNGLSASGFTVDGSGFTSSSQINLGRNASVDNLYPFSAYLRVKVKTGVGSVAPMLAKGISPSANGGWMIGTGSSSNRTVQFAKDGSGGDPIVTSANDVYTLDGAYIDIVVRWDGSTGLSLDVDGVTTTVSAAGTPKTDTTESLYLNFETGHFSYEYVYLFNTEITYAQGEALRANPSNLLANNIFNSITHEVDTTNSLTNGLIFASYFENSNTLPVLGTEKGDNSVGAGADGWEQTGSEHLSFEPPAFKSTGTILLFYRNHPTLAPEPYAKLAITTDAELQLYNASNLGFTVRVGARETAFYAADIKSVGYLSDISSTEFEMIAARYDADTLGRYTLNANGIQKTIDGAPWTPNFSFDTFSLLNRSSDGARQTYGTVQSAFVWDRYLSDAEIASIEANPYQLVKERVKVFSARINLRSNASGAATGNWNEIVGTTLGERISNLTDDTATARGISVSLGGQEANAEALGVNAIGSGNASWVDQPLISDAQFTYNGVTGSFTFSGLDNAKSYDFELYSSRDATGDRTLEASLDSFTTIHEINGAGNTSEVLRFTGLAPLSGSITFEVRKKSTAIAAYLSAIRVSEYASGGTGSTTVENSLATLWGIYQQSSNALELRFNLLQAVANSTAINWSLLQQVITNTDLNWSIFNSVNGQLKVDWSVFGKIAAQLGIEYNILQAVDKSTDLDWSLLQQAESAAQLRFNLLQQAAQSIGIEYNILAPVNRSFTIVWDNDGSLNVVNSALRLEWSLLNAVDAALATEWSLLNSVGVSVELRYQIAQQVAQAIDFQYSIQNSVAASVDLHWNSIEQINGDLSLNWTVQVDEISIPVHTMIITGENRVMTVLGEDRVMKVH